MMLDLDGSEVTDSIIALRVYAKRCAEWARDGGELATHWRQESERCHAASNKFRNALGLKPEPLYKDAAE